MRTNSLWIISGLDKGRWNNRELWKSRTALTVDYMQPEIFEAHSVLRRLLIKLTKYEGPCKMELWTPHSLSFRVPVATGAHLPGFGVFHYVCQSRDTLPGQWATVL